MILILPFILAVVVGLGFLIMRANRKVGISFMLVCGVIVIFLGCALFFVTNLRVMTPEQNRLLGEWVCVDLERNCQPALMFDDTTWQLGQSVTFTAPGLLSDGMVTSGTKICSYKVGYDNSIEINCGGNTTRLVYTMRNDRLTLIFYQQSIELKRPTP